MLESLWILAAVEINGAITSHAANTRLDEHTCAVEYSAVSHAIAKQKPPADGIWRTDPANCQFLASDGMLRIRLPQRHLASSPLKLGELADGASIHVLHTPDTLSTRPAYAGQPDIRSIPSAAVDVFAGSNLRGAGAVLASGPYAVHALRQTLTSATPYRRASAEYLSAAGGMLRLGDFRTDRGPAQALGEYRGIVLTNRASPLRGDGRVEALMHVENPSRVQFFDQSGRQIYSSDMLAPGNYQVQGAGASTVPGFLEARLVNTQGVAQSIFLPWSADRRLLSQNQIEWEVFSGRPRTLGAGLLPRQNSAARLRIGLHAHTTAALHAGHDGRNRDAAVEFNSRWVPGVTTTVAFGQSCSPPEGCGPGWLLEGRAVIQRGLHLAAAVTQGAMDSMPGSVNSFFVTAQTAIHQRLTVSLNLAARRETSGIRHQTQHLSAQIRLRPNLSLHLSARQQRLDGERPQSWQGFAHVVMHFDAGRSLLSSSMGWSPSTSAPRRHLIQAQTGSGQIYGSHVGLSHGLDGHSASDATIRHAAPMGDLSLRASNASQDLAWAGASRLWIMRDRFHLGPAGDDNLVIQRLGLPDVRISQQGRDSQITDRGGDAVFRKASAWTDVSYAIDPASVPMGITLSGGQTRVPLAANRAYLVDHQSRWARQLVWRILQHRDQAQFPMEGTDRHGRHVFIDADGFVDLQSQEQLPINIRDRHGQMLACLPLDTAHQRNMSGTLETPLRCMAALAHQAGLSNTGTLHTGGSR